MLSKTTVNAKESDCIRIMQLSDTHLFSEADRLFDGVDTQASLCRVVAALYQSGNHIDAVLVTGDLVHHAERSAYERLSAQLLKFDCPVFCLPGNHDNPELMDSMLNRDNISTSKSLLFDNWQVILLNSYLPQTHSGALSEKELDFLESSLREADTRHVLVAVHHHPVPVQSPWMDKMMLENGDELFTLLKKFPQVKAIICGHVHQDLGLSQGGIQFFSCPSTCVQFSPRSAEYIKDNLGPGYREILLKMDGQIQTSAHWLSLD